MTAIRFLINNNGIPFDSSELRTLVQQFNGLTDAERTEYRNQNALTIAEHNAIRFLIVSGPGTGKSRLFMQKIDNWYQKDQNATVLVTSFVRKLVADLQSDIDTDEKLISEQKGKITASTLHKFARSIVEKNHGTTEWSFKPHFRIIGQFWKEIVWNDVIAFFSDIDLDAYSWKEFEGQLHGNSFKEFGEWNGLKETYFKLCQFYNAAGFADLIIRATKALMENPNLNENNYFIIDEYQDFNLAEEALINQLVDNPEGLLVVGDDEQVLYEKLKSSKPTLIRNLYKKTDYANGMLPFCGRSSSHIVQTANHFVQQNREVDCIEKIFLPLNPCDGEPKVQVIACATSPTAVDYIEQFVVDHQAEIDERKTKLEIHEAKDPFLLILTPAKEVNFYGESKEKIKRIVSEYLTERRSFSEDYYQLLSYYSVASTPYNNFNFRKVLHYERIPQDKAHMLSVKAIQGNMNFCDLDFQEIKDALSKCTRIKNILEKEITAAEKLEQISSLITITNKEKLQKEIEESAINKEVEERQECEKEEEVELEEVEVRRMGAVELMTIVGSKGLSADHVIIIGFDNVNMNWVTKNAFYVAMTRARKSLHLLTALKSGGATQTNDSLNRLPEEHMEFYSYKKSDHSKTLLSGMLQFKNYLDRLNSVSRGRR